MTVFTRRAFTLLLALVTACAAASACVNLDLPGACSSRPERCGDASSAEDSNSADTALAADTGSASDGDVAADAAPADGGGDGATTCAPTDECATGETRTVVGSCPKVGEVKQQRCEGCKWLPAECVAKKGWRAMAAPPSTLLARSRHSAVWTGGTEMIVFGGYVEGATGSSGTGARYDVDLDAWTMLPPLPSSGFPVLGGLSKSVWTGSQLVVWAGGESPAPAGAVWDKASNSWKSMAAGSLAARENYVMSYAPTTSRVLVWGGQWSVDCSADGAEYDPSTNAWTALPASPLSARQGAAHVWTGDQLLIWGGYCEGSLFHDGATYNPSTKTWTKLPAAPLESDPRRDFGYAFDGTYFYAWGGWDGGINIFTDGLKYKLGGGWTLVPKLESTVLPGPDRATTQMWAKDGVFWMWSGATGGGTTRPGGARYSTTWSAIDITGEPKARSRASVVFTGTSAIVWGGFDGSKALADGGIYTP